MLNLDGYDDVDVNENDYLTLPPDGYICRIISAEIVQVNDRHQLQISVDIAEGKYKDFYKNKFLRNTENNADNAQWDFNAVFKRYVFANGKVSPGFKSVVEAVRISNADFKLDKKNFDEQCLVGQLCGFTFGQKEVQGKDGKPNWFTAKIGFPCSIDKIREGKFKIPKTEKLKGNTADSDPDGFNGKSLSDDDMPF